MLSNFRNTQRARILIVLEGQYGRFMPLYDSKHFTNWNVRQFESPSKGFDFIIIKGKHFYPNYLKTIHPNHNNIFHSSNHLSSRHCKGENNDELRQIKKQISIYRN